MLSLLPPDDTPKHEERSALDRARDRLLWRSDVETARKIEREPLCAVAISKADENEGEDD